MNQPRVPSTACPNCERPLEPADRFCRACGQRTRYGPRPLRESVQDVLGRDYAPDGRLWLTLQALVRPGKLTADWFAGRQQRYLGPTRLFLLVLFVAIIAMQGLMRLLVPVMPQRSADEGPRHFELGLPLAGVAPVLDHRYATTRVVLHGGVLAPWLQGLARSARAALERIDEREFRQRMRSAVIPARINGRALLLPLLVALLAAVHAGQHRTLGEHVVFVLHLESAVVLVAMLLVLPFELLWHRTALFFGAMTVFTGVWLMLSMKRFYGNGWPATLWRALVVLAAGFGASAHLDAVLALAALT